MKHVSTHIDDALAERFLALARARGGKSALLCRLVRLAVDGQKSEQAPTLPDSAGRAVHLSVRLSANEVAEVRKAAAARGMKPSRWLARWFACGSGAGTRYSGSELHELRAVTGAGSVFDIDGLVVLRSPGGERLTAEFASYRYVFALHDRVSDPRHAAAGGQRPYVHVHGIIAMRSDAGMRLNTTIAGFPRWRLTLAETACTHGITMEMTDQPERASAPTYRQSQVRPVRTIGRTEHQGTSAAAQRRHERMRADTSAPGQDPSSLAFGAPVSQRLPRRAASILPHSRVADAAATCNYDEGRMLMWGEKLRVGSSYLIIVMLTCYILPQ